ncbi:MAG TPA: isoprenylcysteine carboxylmethyltransferase family protein [Lacipirellulaceae bacterium]|nr:isoprenylcysteine carboxylmethyltransferase family protein [Lacipirellulaceae bacterium]
MTIEDVYTPTTPLSIRIRALLARYRIRISLFVVCGLVATDMLRAVRPHAPFSLSDPWSAVGVTLIVLGTLMRSWAAGVLTKNSELSTTGPYAITRNPLYLGSFLMMIGFCTLVGRWHDYVVMLILAVLLYWPKIISEESFLRAKFGPQWDEFFNTTPRLLPHRINLSKARSEWSFAQWKRNSEPVTVLAAVAGLVIFQAWSILLPHIRNL